MSSPTDQAVCAVTGDIVDKAAAEAAGHVREFNGQKYYLCSGTCAALFDEDPATHTAHHETHTVLTLKEKEHLVDNVWAFRFVPSQPLTWIAGQFMRVQLPHDNADKEGTKRWFTVSSAPYQEIIQITTRVTESTFKQTLANLPIGGQVPLLEKPDGDFVWQDSARPLVFIAGGIGITPFRSIFKQRAHDHQPLNLTLIYGNRTDQVVFKDELDAWTAEHPELRVEYVTGPLTTGKIHELVPNLNDSQVYLSGPEPMVESLGDQLKLAGLPESQLRQDFFPNYTETNY